MFANVDALDRNELLAVWRTFDLAKAFVSRVDVRLLFENPFLRQNTRYRRYMILHDVKR